MKQIQRGLEAHQEQDPGLLLRDTRTMGQRIGAFFRNPTSVLIVLVMTAVATFLLPAIADILLVGGVIAFLFAYLVKAILPFRMPLGADRVDYNDLAPGSNKPLKARGIYFFGNEKKTDLELWFSNDDMRTHALIFGSTGSGKTEALISLAYNALLQGSGFIYVDGKGDNSLYASIFSMVRSMGREDDILLINFMTGAKDIIGPQKKRLSNTMNPFAVGSSSMLSQLVVSLMDSSAQSSDGDMWKGRAIAFVESLMKVLVAMRDAGHILLDANSIRNYFALERIEAMVLDNTFIRDGKDPVSLEFLPEVVMEPIRNYLITLPGYNKAKKGKQVSQVLEQHGFITMQLVRVFTSLADTYGHILRTKLAEVDLNDVVLNRRILLVLLPALEKSPDELANLGKIVIASLRAMMASGLGDAVEGEYRDLIQRKPTNAPTPFLCILDEYGYYAVEGFAVVPAQARSLGFSVIFAGQDLPAFQKASKEEAASIGANTNIKICMKLEDPIETWEFFQKTAGESYVTHTGGFQANEQSMSNTYMDSRSAQLEKRARVDLLDLKEQAVGEAHFFFKSKIVRARFFYAAPKPVKVMRLNQFLKVDVPPDEEIYNLARGFDQFQKLSTQGPTPIDESTLSTDLEAIIDKMHEDVTPFAIERGVSALLNFHDRDIPERVEEDVESEMQGDELNLFTRLRTDHSRDELILCDDFAGFSEPLLERGPTREQTEYLERLSGKSDKESITVANDIIKDMQLATHYPPQVFVKPTVEEMSQTIDTLVEHIAIKKKEKADKDAGDALPL